MKYIATKSFKTHIDGERTEIIRGVTVVDEYHAAYRHFPENFKPCRDHRDVEQATAAPGERRGEK